MALREPGINFIAGSGVTITTADNTTLHVVDVTIAAATGDPSTDTKVWMPLTTTVGTDDVLVFDASHQLIPTLTPI